VVGDLGVLSGLGSLGVGGVRALSCFRPFSDYTYMDMKYTRYVRLHAAPWTLFTSTAFRQ
jgi:hypothetical protein